MEKTVSSQSQSAGPRLSGNPGRWLQCTLPPEQHQAPTWSKAKQIAGVWSRWNFFLHFVPIHIHLAQWEAEACSLEGGLQPEASFNSAYPLGEGQLRVQQWPETLTHYVFLARARVWIACGLWQQDRLQFMVHWGSAAGQSCLTQLPCHPLQRSSSGTQETCTGLPGGASVWDTEEKEKERCVFICTLNADSFKV